MGALDLTGEQHEELFRTILDAYSRAALQRELKFGLDKNLEQIVAPGSLEDQVFQLIDVAEDEGWVSALIDTLRASRPGRPEFAKLSETFGLEPPPTDPTALERMVSEGRGYRDPAVEARGLFWMARRIGRIEVRGTPKGTGFLIGADLVMTNYHVVRSSIEDGTPGAQIRFRIDFRRAEDGIATSAGTEHPLVDGVWLLASGGTSSQDEQAWDPHKSPGLDALDFAVLRLAESVGSRSVGAQRERGWLDLTSLGNTPERDDYLAIFGFPGPTSPLVYDGAYPSMIDFNSKRTRMRYRTNTDYGMSGSPVMDRTYKLVALHNARDPRSGPGDHDKYNIGVPIPSIVEAITSIPEADRSFHLSSPPE